MFTNQVPDWPDFGRTPTVAIRPNLVQPSPELYPVPENPPQGWGLTFMMPNGAMTGRSKSAVFWAGLANLFWWCDREAGVAGFVCTQILPFGDMNVLQMWGQLEYVIYQALAQAGK